MFFTSYCRVRESFFVIFFMIYLYVRLNTVRGVPHPDCGPFCLFGVLMGIETSRKRGQVDV